MKSERIVLLTTPEFKSFLSQEAKREGTSVAELVRSRCHAPRPSADEEMLRALAAELRASVTAAKRALNEGLTEAKAVLDDLHAARAPRPRSTRARKAA